MPCVALLLAEVVEDDALSQLMSSRQNGSANNGRIQRLIVVMAVEQVGEIVIIVLPENSVFNSVLKPCQYDR